VAARGCGGAAGSGGCAAITTGAGVAVIGVAGTTCWGVGARMFVRMRSSSAMTAAADGLALGCDAKQRHTRAAISGGSAGCAGGVGAASTS
jgi:hypothetical protein